MAQVLTTPALEQPSSTGVFQQYESNVRTYCRSFPVVFARGEGSYLIDRDGTRYLDFLSGAGSMNYGHNHPVLREALLDYIHKDGLVNSLDLHTTAKEEFLLALNEIVLQPRQLEYRCQFCGPTGTNAVEAALKLARKVTNRRGIVAFSNSYHGMSAGSMRISSSQTKYGQEAYFESGHVDFLPFEGFTGCQDEIQFIRALLTRKNSGIQPPAAIILELVQCEGGVNVPSVEWVRQIAELAKELKAILIVDEIQTGCGRTGKFFCFEHYGIVPQIITVSKSISAYGFPMSILLIDPTLDQWERGEHTGTFRGFTYSYVTGTKALRHFWTNSDFISSMSLISSQLKESLESLKQEFAGHVLEIRQLGMLSGIKLLNSALVASTQRHCFKRGLIIEYVGPNSDTLKLLPPLTISAGELRSGVSILREALGDAVRGN
jgi:diaminobutyrate-2-oxoglutarate transaminase